MKVQPGRCRERPQYEPPRQVICAGQPGSGTSGRESLPARMRGRRASSPRSCRLARRCRHVCPSIRELAAQGSSLRVGRSRQYVLAIRREGRPPDAGQGGHDTVSAEDLGAAGIRFLDRMGPPGDRPIDRELRRGLGGRRLGDHRVAAAVGRDEDDVSLGPRADLRDDLGPVRRPVVDYERPAAAAGRARWVGRPCRPGPSRRGGWSRHRCHRT